MPSCTVENHVHLRGRPIRRRCAEDDQGRSRRTDGQAVEGSAGCQSGDEPLGEKVLCAEEL